MKKRNSYILYSIILGALSVCLLFCVLMAKDMDKRIVLLFCENLSLAVFAVCVKNAHQTFYYNKAIDAWNNWNEEKGKCEPMEIKRAESVFEEYGFDDEE